MPDEGLACCTSHLSLTQALNVHTQGPITVWLCLVVFITHTKCPYSGAHYDVVTLLSAQYVSGLHQTRSQLGRNVEKKGNAVQSTGCI